ncbi:divinyl protochlorophyllide a 8-vinyl-reductase [Rhodobacter sp. JA431]|uniref:bacteriochlorophyll 4-vinyl reductase n=1 Tax=Rhodobacter sp. JA431 TaxID=570013 RepID=UPI000BD6B4C7|nr:bacteriochlorophyll 4-vinyl reductase [Rhodobacter sp. JA431]SOB90803.1 divinyl protochlorophyllide a 8-vinyl-reductase [Rhodobacter sp. JA431]
MSAAPLDAQDEPRIGPNAILQTIAVLDRHLGRSERDRIMKLAGVPVPPADSGMLPESQCHAVHQALRVDQGEASEGLLWLSGLATGDYILANRIPGFAQKIIKFLPASLGAKVLAKAITKHAWTFVGSGQFQVEGCKPLTFRIDGNPLRAESAEHPACHWHAAVFQRLFSTLVWPDCKVEEISCASMGSGPCRFVLHPQGGRASHPAPVHSG